MPNPKQQHLILYWRSRSDTYGLAPCLRARYILGGATGLEVPFDILAEEPWPRAAIGHHNTHSNTHCILTIPLKLIDGVLSVCVSVQQYRPPWRKATEFDLTATCSDVMLTVLRCLAPRPPPYRFTIHAVDVAMGVPKNTADTVQDCTAFSDDTLSDALETLEVAFVHFTVSRPVEARPAPVYPAMLGMMMTVATSGSHPLSTRHAGDPDSFRGRRDTSTI